MSIDDPTAAELLTAVNAAILELITDRTKQFTVAGRVYSYNDLNDLRAMRTELQKETRSESGSVRLGDFSGE